jgi:hypothetical protein
MERAHSADGVGGGGRGGGGWVIGYCDANNLEIIVGHTSVKSVNFLFDN